MTAALLLALAVAAAAPWALGAVRRPKGRPGGAADRGRAGDAGHRGRAGDAAERSHPPGVVRRRRRGSPEGVDPAVLLDLVGAALEAGSSVPGALVALGEAIGGSPGGVLRRAGSALLLGASWPDAWAGAPPGALLLADALEPAWLDGVAAGPLLRRAADRVRAERSDLAKEAAARLGVRLVLPLGLCFLPAFVLLGLVPVVLGSGAGMVGP